MPIILPKCPDNYKLIKDKCRCKKKTIKKKKPKKKNKKEKEKKDYQTIKRRM